MGEKDTARLVMKSERPALHCFIKKEKVMHHASAAEHDMLSITILRIQQSLINHFCCFYLLRMTHNVIINYKKMLRTFATVTSFFYKQPDGASSESQLQWTQHTVKSHLCSCLIQVTVTKHVHRCRLSQEKWKYPSDSNPSSIVTVNKEWLTPAWGRVHFFSYLNSITNLYMLPSLCVPSYISPFCGKAAHLLEAFSNGVFGIYKKTSRMRT